MDSLALIGAVLGMTFLGVGAGTLTGLAPGIHVNNVAALVLATRAAWGSLIALLAAGPSPEETSLLLSVFLVAATVAHAVLDFVPSVFLGAPSEEVGTLLPGHRMLLSGDGATAVALAGREKALDALLAGFKAKAADVPNPYDVPEAAYRKTADRIGRALFVGEVRLPSRAVPDLHGKLTALAQQAGTKVHLFAALRGTGTASAFPAFEAQKDRTRTYDLSKGVDRVAGTIPGALFASRLAHLWREDEEYVRRVRLLRALKLEIDAAHVVQPLAAV